MRIFVTGGTGLVGRRIVRRLNERGDQAVILTRRGDHARELFGNNTAVVEGDPMRASGWMDAVADCDAVIHLAGENIFARRWNDDFKKLLMDSRIVSTQHVVEALRRRPTRADGQAKTLVNASAIGYYGPRGDEELTEESAPGSDFLAKLCIEWEQAARAAASAGIRVAMVRVGVVLDKEGGALAKMLTPFKLGAGGPLGSGRQWMSWIHHDDLVGLFLLAVDNPAARGPINGTAPNPLTNREFSRTLGRVLHRPSFVWTPALALRVVLGEVATVIATGQRVLPKRALELGYSFRYPTLDAALTQILT
ncbi:MAG TPA: TIGR01777 family oxidoreductase [Gemmataceae bacterium]|nr:TIGR01777 family oxidoreductase [Gemmataceae bacterium]